LGTRRFSGAVRSGTPGYAPLEQYARQAQVGTYTDVYALAATLYHMLTGKEPVEATDRAREPICPRAGAQSTHRRRLVAGRDAGAFDGAAQSASNGARVHG
jgi:serine/threonine protein kinase